MKVAAFAILLVVLAGGWSRWDAARGDAPLNRIASQIAGRPVHVACTGFFANLIDVHGTNGEVQFNTSHLPSKTTLRRWVCQSLKRFDQKKLQCLVQRTYCGNDTRRTIDAVVTLAHESFHLRGVGEEGRTQCYAVQEAAATAHALGADPAVADALARWYMAFYQPNMPQEYQLPQGCYDGGPLDLAPNAPGWPNPQTR